MKISKVFVDLARPFYYPCLRFIRRLSINEGSFSRDPNLPLPAPWDYVQFKVERDLHSFLHVDPKDIQSVVVIGANIGNEVYDIRRTYPNTSFIMFEPSPKYFPELLRAHGKKSYVKCYQKACGDFCGKTVFYELPMAGNGSFLKPTTDWKIFNIQEDDNISEYTVDVTTLDSEIPKNAKTDLLWVDVQGAELHVLKGARETLKNTKAVFLEVALCKSPYHEGALIRELNEVMIQTGHQLVLLGLDPWNFTGNALWVQHPEKLLIRKI